MTQTVVITGASAGVGLAVAEAFGRRGARVALLARGQVGLQAAAEEVRRLGGTPLVIDVADADADAVEDAAGCIELPPNDENPRTRVANADEADSLIAALDPADSVPYAFAFYAGLRRAEIKRLDWPDVELDGYRLVVRKAKSQAGTGRRPPIAEPLRPILLGEFMRQGRRESGAVSAVSVMSGKIAERARKRWEAAGLEPITLRECRHTYASFLMAAGYTLRELMAYMGHSSLQATERYVKLLPPLDESDPAERLNAYLRRRAQ
jgi:integrase